MIAPTKLERLKVSPPIRSARNTPASEASAVASTASARPQERNATSSTSSTPHEASVSTRESPPKELCCSAHWPAISRRSPGATVRLSRSRRWMSATAPPRSRPASRAVTATMLR